MDDYLRLKYRKMLTLHDGSDTVKSDKVVRPYVLSDRTD